MFASRYPSPKALSARCDKTPPSEKTFGRRVRAFLSQCDLVILCGGRMSDGMALEEAHARSLGKPILSLLHFGEIPPAEAPILSLPL